MALIQDNGKLQTPPLSSLKDELKRLLCLPSTRKSIILKPFAVYSERMESFNNGLEIRRSHRLEGKLFLLQNVRLFYSKTIKDEKQRETVDSKKNSEIL